LTKVNSEIESDAHQIGNKAGLERMDLDKRMKVLEGELAPPEEERKVKQMLPANGMFRAIRRAELQMAAGGKSGVNKLKRHEAVHGAGDWYPSKRGRRKF
jgi:hypothetical protein